MENFKQKEELSTKQLILIFLLVIVAAIFLGLYLKNYLEHSREIKKKEVATKDRIKKNRFSSNKNEDYTNSDSLLEIENSKKKANRNLALKYAKKHFRVQYDDIENIHWIYDYSSPKYDNYYGVYTYLGVTDNSLGVRFKIQYAGDDWLFIKRIIFKIDGYNYTFEPTDVNRDNNGDGIWETIDVDATSSEVSMIIMALRSSNSAKIRFEGSHYHKDKILTKKQIEAIKRIYDLRYRIEPL